MCFNFHGFLMLFHVRRPALSERWFACKRARVEGLFMVMVVMVAGLTFEGAFRLGPVVRRVN